MNSVITSLNGVNQPASTPSSYTTNMRAEPKLPYGISTVQAQPIELRTAKSVPLAELDAVDGIRHEGSWGQKFNKLIRTDLPTYWGNWNLDQSIAVGKVGKIDPETGAFTELGELNLSENTSNRPIVEGWSISTEHTDKKTKTFTADAAITGITRSDSDTASTTAEGNQPDTDTASTTAEGIQPNSASPLHAELTYKLDKAGSIVADWNLTSHQAISSPLKTLLSDSSLEQLKDIARKNGLYDETSGFSQGFGIITSVDFAKGGSNIASTSDDATLTFKGELKGIINMQKGHADAGVSAGYEHISTSKNVVHHTWPASANIAPGNGGETSSDDTASSKIEVPVRFQFASLTGQNEVIPDWTRPIRSLEIKLKNTLGSTYIVKAKLSYKIPGQDSPVEEKVRIIGGLTVLLGDIPIDATDLKLQTKFKGIINSDKRLTLHAKTPLSEWRTGKKLVSLNGIWPGETTVKTQDIV